MSASSSQLRTLLHDLLHDLQSEESGQSTVEYMLLISVIVIALVAAAYVFVDPFKQGVQDLANDVRKMLSTGKISKSGAH
jgi:Flp pilus assembly pilin Flp